MQDLENEAYDNMQEIITKHKKKKKPNQAIKLEQANLRSITQNG